MRKEEKGGEVSVGSRTRKYKNVELSNMRGTRREQRMEMIGKQLPA